MHRNSYKTFKALGILLSYPSVQWQSHLVDLCDLLYEEALLGDGDRQAIRTFAEVMAAQDAYDLQESYVDTFDRVRSLSLHLFEHVHGESRDRGQAMVDLMGFYKEEGLALAQSELPDYLPIFLEYLSYLDKDEALEMLDQPAHILVAVGKRLAERGSPYRAVFDALIHLSGREPEKVTEYRTETITPEQLDKEWEEQPIEFLGAEAPKAAAVGCGSGGCGSGGCGSIKPEGARI